MTQPGPHRHRATPPGRGSSAAANPFGLMGVLLRWPLRVFESGTEILNQSLRGIQGTAGRAGETVRPVSATRSATWQPIAPTAAEPRDGDDSRSEVSTVAGPGSARNIPKEKAMTNTDLRDDMLKLVSYSIVNIERGRERTLVCNECQLFSDNMSDCDFDTWVVADFIERWQHDHPGKRFPYNNKDLRVVHQVQGRWPKQDLRFEEKQLHRLAGIQHAIEEGLGSYPVPPPEQSEG